MLSPVEYKFTTSPLKSTGADLLKLTLQHLCLEDVIQIEQRGVLLHARERRRRQRFFFKRGAQFDSFKAQKSAEKFVLDLFKDHEEFRFYVLRHYVKSHFGKMGTDPFKSDYVMKDLRKAGLTFLWYFPSSKATEVAEAITSRLNIIDTSIDRLIDKDQDQLITLLNQLGSNIIFLETETIEKINAISDDIRRIKDLSFVAVMNNSFNAMDTFFYTDFSGFDSIDHGGFDGFGGGDFGGGGAFGEW